MFVFQLLPGRDRAGLEKTEQFGPVGIEQVALLRVIPLCCTLELYHSHAGMLMGNALQALETALAERLAR